jgi:hypothetical protein
LITLSIKMRANGKNASAGFKVNYRLEFPFLSACGVSKTLKINGHAESTSISLLVARAWLDAFLSKSGRRDRGRPI